MQLTVNAEPAVAIAGMLADNWSIADGDRETCVCETDIPAGVFVVQGTGFVDGRRQVKVANGSTLGELIGVSKYDATTQQREPTTPGDFTTIPPLYRAGDVITVVKKGRVWMGYVGTAITASGVALQVRTTAGVSQGFATSTTADSSNLATGLKSREPSVGSLIKVDLNLP